jgi:hypothetical protein
MKEVTIASLAYIATLVTIYPHLSTVIASHVSLQGSFRFEFQRSLLQE